MLVPEGLHVVERPGDGPDAPLVVIVHGAMDRSSSFGRVDRRLRDLHVVRYDRRGYGRSRDVGVGPIAEHIDDLLAVLADRPAILFGHSVGAIVALGAAACRPDLVGSVLAYEPPMGWAPWWPTAADRAAADPAAGAEAFMRAAVGDHIWNRLPARTRDDRRAEGDALRADTASMSDAPPVDLGAVVAPVVVAVGSATSDRHRRAGEELAAGLAHGQLVVVDGARHGAHLTHAPAVAGLVRQLVERGSAQ